ncbi:DUF2153 domain-containing protein [Desulfurococcaceae archaeon MEX13E-LK6-19]|nr:DUF2153 domain-containing protein [Desulfurococcaceae archaeon MEX13E-LK6-19]
MLSNLDAWVRKQKEVLESFRKAEESNKNPDRLDLIVLSRTAFQHMIRTITAFDQWLQEPFVISHMPKEMLEDVWNTVRKILNELLELDIRHTSGFKEYIEKLAKEGKLNPILVSPKEVPRRISLST